MYLVRLVYSSAISEGFGRDDIAEILTTAQKRNAGNEVTGWLCFNRKRFLQCLEGSRSAVNETYHRILNDPRHNSVVLLDYQEIVEREFSDWAMGFIPESSLTAPVNLRYSGSAEFDPYSMSGESAHRLMLSIKDSVPTVNQAVLNRVS